MGAKKPVKAVAATPSKSDSGVPGYLKQKGTMREEKKQKAKVAAEAKMSAAEEDPLKKLDETQDKLDASQQVR